jgi:hypothetical protein
MGFEDLTKVRAAVLYGPGGNKIASQYYDDYIPEAQRAAFETQLYQKVSEDSRSEALQFDRYIVVIRSLQDMNLVLVGDLKINELLFAQILDTLDAAIELIFKKVSVDAFIKDLDNFYLMLDEALDQGYVLEPSGHVLAARVLLKDDGAFIGKATKMNPRF